MTGRARTVVITVLWSLLVILALVSLGLGFVTGNVVLIGIAAVSTYAVVKTLHLVPLPKVYTDRGITNDLFLSRRQQKINQERKEKLDG